MAVMAQSTIESSSAQSSAGDTHDDLGAQDVADIGATTAALVQPSITVPTDHLTAGDMDVDDKTAQPKTNVMVAQPSIVDVQMASVAPDVEDLR